MISFIDVGFITRLKSKVKSSHCLFSKTQTHSVYIKQRKFLVWETGTRNILSFLINKQFKQNSCRLIFCLSNWSINCFSSRRCCLALRNDAQYATTPGRAGCLLLLVVKVHCGKSTIPHWTCSFYTLPVCTESLLCCECDFMQSGALVPPRWPFVTVW